MRDLFWARFIWVSPEIWARAARGLGRGRARECLPPWLKNFHFYFAWAKLNPIGWKWHISINFRGECRNVLNRVPGESWRWERVKLVSEVTPKKKVMRRRNALFPSVQDFCRLCGCSFKVQYGSQVRQIETENLFHPSKQTGSIGVVLAKQSENIGLTLKQWRKIGPSL